MKDVSIIVLKNNNMDPELVVPRFCLHRGFDMFLVLHITSSASLIYICVGKSFATNSMSQFNVTNGIPCLNQLSPSNLNQTGINTKMV